MNTAPTTAQARADAARQSPFWPFGTLTPHQQRQQAAMQRAMQSKALAQLPAALL